MKKLILICAISLAGIVSVNANTSNTPDDLVRIDCDSWVDGFMLAYENFNGCQSAENYNNVYSNMMDYCTENLNEN